MLLSKQEPALILAVCSFVCLVTCIAAAAPLFVYTASLATFGAAHVLSELRFIERRFSTSLSTPQIAVIGLLLAAAVTSRALGVFKLVETGTAISMELIFVVALALTVVKGGGIVCSALAVGLAVFIGAATLVATFETLVVLSVLHNLTPLAFLWNLLPVGRRGLGMALAAFAFVGGPLLISTGIPRAVLQSFDLLFPNLDPLHAGSIADHYYVFVPGPLLDGARAIDLFSAAVAAQCAHYAAVIVVLPRLLEHIEPNARGLVTWPRASVFVSLVIVIAGGLLYGFAHAFSATRSLYGIAASLHAWIEVPLIILAVTQRSPIQPSRCR